MEFDVAIIGGGPGGSTTGTLLKKHNPALRVAIFERETFPRDHVGESQLPGISAVLDEMGAWDKVEAANFPIKLGGTYRWGRSRELWDVMFYPIDKFENQARPAKYEGQRRATAFQVDRAIYDKILLDHAREMGCEVFENTRVTEIEREGDRVAGLKLQNGEKVTARHYVDASGHAGILRRAMGVQVEYPTTLQNIAIWDYWQNADWAVEIGVGGTFIQVMSVGYGWIWFIPLGPTRTSIGLVIPAEYYKQSGRRPAELYEKALKDDDRIANLMRNAVSENKLTTTKDWSFLASRQTGENWMLVGESGGFADPILSAGLTITHAAGREAAFTILELDRGKVDSAWLKKQYGVRQSQRVTNHMRFADYWYTTNEQLTDLKGFIQKIASDNGLDLTPDNAWSWLAQGGFIRDDLSTGTGSFSVQAIRALGEFLSEVPAASPLNSNNVFTLDLKGASWTTLAHYEAGAVSKRDAYERDGKLLPMDGLFDLLIQILQRERTSRGIVDALNQSFEHLRSDPMRRHHVVISALRAWEALVLDGWVAASHDPTQPLLDLSSEYTAVGWNKYAAES
ncbi:NAD(P)/FAD-dependent oxidoreductase [Fimbriimonas ginsengisoli]|uniref:Halogenase n=1 Tax=Fimbriimonas ginsengisoli Gsoil 348 TaxID=661478 RepID=A0A068NXU5_FIMGI|nr:NAD(P)/FAD-dependent oxidoreductase [Fimbriimonas ginsengisoli]AIE87585.1 halogenase [Fimbriimonas ginsengisoli Gsoil 348]